MTPLQFADAGYHSQPLTEWLRTLGGWALKIVGSVTNWDDVRIEPKRWIVERIFGRMNRDWRLSKDDDAHPETSEVMVLIAMTYLMERRVRK